MFQGERKIQLAFMIIGLYITIMKIALIYPSNSQLISRMPLGLLRVANYINANSHHKAKVIDLASYLKNGTVQINRNLYKNCAEFIMQKFPSDIYAFSTIVTAEIPALQIAREIKNIDKSKIIILGNQWADCNAKRILEEFNQIDIIIRGEGEITFLDILNNIENHGLENVKGIAYRNVEGNIHSTSNRELIKNLDDLPLLDLDCLNPVYSQYSKSEFGGYYGLLEYGRGCPFCCSFCSTSRFWDRKVRVYSNDRTIKEMFYLKARGFDFIEFTYDNFGTYKNELKQFCQEIINSELGIKWSIRCRLDFLDLPMIKLLSQAGCVSVLVGLESGSDRVLDKVGKRISVNKEIEIIKILIKEGIRVDASFVTGLSYESKKDTLETLRFAAILKIFGKLISTQIHFTAPLPGTQDTINAIKDNELIFSNNPNIAPDFSRFLDWYQYFDKTKSDRFQEDQALIDKYPDLFVAYGYIYNKTIKPERFAAISSYYNILIQFFPITLVGIIDYLNDGSIDLIDDFEEFIVSLGFDMEYYLSLNIEIKSSIDVGLQLKNQELLNLFVKYIEGMPEVPKAIKCVLDYEKALMSLSAQTISYPDIIMDEITESSVIKFISRIYEFEYDVNQILKVIKEAVLNNERYIDWNAYEPQMTYYVFSPIPESSRYFSGIRISKISKGTCKILLSFCNPNSIKAVSKRLFNNELANKKEEIVKSFLKFVNDNKYMWEMR